LPSVYLLQHIAREGTDDEDMKILGIYSNERKPKRAIAQFVKLPGFKRYPESFYIDRYQLDESKWTEGFIARRSKSKSVTQTRKPGNSV